MQSAMLMMFYLMLAMFDMYKMHKQGGRCVYSGRRTIPHHCLIPNKTPSVEVLAYIRSPPTIQKIEKIEKYMYI